MTDQSALRLRADIPIEETWDLSGMFADDDAWNAAAESAPAEIESVAAYRGSFVNGPAAIRVALDASYALQEKLGKLIVYALLRKDEDQTNTENLARADKAIQISVLAGEKLSWVTPELVALSPEDMAAAIASEELAPYRFQLENIERGRAHVRSEEVETVLAQLSEVLGASGDVMGALDDADIDYGTITDEDGNEVHLTKGRYAVIQEGRNRDVRAAASKAFHKPYHAHTYTFGSLFSTSVKGDVAGARIRGHESARAAALFSNNIPESVYDTLVQTVREKATPVVGRYLKLRMRALGLDKLKSYDGRVPLTPESKVIYSFDQGRDIVLNGLGALGETYVNDLRDGFSSRWVDIHETKGKRSGAYSWGTYGAPPVMLMNWNGTLNDVFTLAHEAGHSMHSFYAQEAQPIQYAGYSIFLAEIASTVNEVLLNWHLLNQPESQDPVQRFSLLNRFADTYLGTVGRQTMFAEFEQVTHEMVENGGALVPEVLSQIFGDLFATYNPGYEIDDSITITWARIPHFYNAFYVYQYATGMSSAINLAAAVRDEGEEARVRYLEMLAAGGNDYPMNVLKRAGVDLETAAPIERGIAEFDAVITEMEKLADEGVLEQAAAQL
ncbi:MAG: oligoendopeptidase F [Thermomicrobiales bacterium]|nr:oligoendopeptidase F [Thermomicrobiales bacterium]